ncbi:hypothetical protein [Treponema sp. R6D11]
MKKALFILFIAVFLGSCQDEFDNVKYTITNDSSKNIRFTFNDVIKTLAKDTSITYTINSGQGRFAPEKISFSGHIKSINLETMNNGTSGIFYTFTDNIPLTLNVVNMLSIPITITADDFIDNQGQPSIKIIEDAEETALIYTSTPNFSVTESAKEERTLDPAEVGFIPYPYPYQIKFDWELIDENTMNLTIN